MKWWRRCVWARNTSSSDCTPVLGDALDGASYLHHIGESETFIQLVRVPHPSQAKAKEFVAVDQRSGIEAIRAAKCASVAHFIYVRVGHPAPGMHAYIAVRSVCEAELEASGLNATILRPWYVLGPGHRWPYALIPFCWLAEGPSTIAKARGGWGCGRGRRRRSIRQPASASLKCPRFGRLKSMVNFFSGGRPRISARKGR